jgi:hypothetical protein
MNAPRKVYVASTLERDAINETFQWPQGFARTTELDDAEFIVLDLDNLPDDWLSYFGRRNDFYIPTQNLPFFLVTLSGVPPPQFTDIKKLYKPTEPPVYKTPQELFNSLQWMQLILPFYNDKKARSDSVELAAALQALATKKGPGV